MVLGPIRSDGSYDRRRIESEIARLESLLADLRRIANGRVPFRGDIPDAPLIDGWSFDLIQHLCLRGVVSGHPDPRVGKPGWITATSDLWVLDRVRGVARTMNRWYRLGTEALEGRSLQ